MKEYFVYILQCADGSYYIGITNDMEKRLAQHQEGRDPNAYTHTRRPVHLACRATFSDVSEAIAWEKQLKRWSRKKKQALIRGDQQALEQYASRRGGKPRAK